MEMNDDQSEYVDWKGRSVQPTKHGGKRGAAFVCVFEVLQNMVFISNASNLVTFFHSYMNYPLATSSNMVTNFMGTTFLITLFGGFLSDAYLKRFWSVILFACMQLLGLIMLMIQAHFGSLRPSENESPSSSHAAMLFVGLYAMALGVGGVKASLPAHGADQFDPSNKQVIASYFNWFFFCLCTGGMLAVTLLVWIQENKGWEWGLGFCIVSLSIAIVILSIGFKYYRHKIPGGSPITQIFKVFAYCACNWRASVDITTSVEHRGKHHTKFRFLEKAMIDGHVTASEVEETKTFLSLLVIFASTIMMNCCLAQLQTFSVLQGRTMNTKVSNGFKIPPASLTAIPLMVMLISVPSYDRFSFLIVRKGRKLNFVSKPLQRIGVGLFLASLSMVVAAVLEIKRRNAAVEGNTITIFWLAWQFLLLGISDMFTLAGMLEFFYSEAPDTMRSISTSLSWCSTAMGYFLSSLLVTIVNLASGKYGSRQWLDATNLNSSRLDLFYALISVLNFINFINYLCWAKWY